MKNSDFDPHALANVVDGCFCRFDHATGTDERVFRIVQPIRHDDIVTTTRETRILIHYGFQCGQDAIVVLALGDLALHVTVLVLNHSRHQRDPRIEQRPRPFRRMSDELLHQFRFRQPYIFDRVSCEKTILHVKERSFGFFRGAAADQCQIARFLCVPGHQNAPAAVRNTVYVVMSGMHVQ